MLEDILSNKEEVLNALKNKGDKSIILIAMVNATFPFAFDTLNLFSTYFQVQEYVSWDLIQKEIKNKYGSNRSTENALYSVIPMFIESGILIRTKPGLYQIKNELFIHSQIVYNLYLKSYNINNPIISNTDIVAYEPYVSLISLY